MASTWNKEWKACIALQTKASLGSTYQLQEQYIAAQDIAALG